MSLGGEESFLEDVYIMQRVEDVLDAGNSMC